MKFFLLVIRSLGRNKLRSTLTVGAIVLLVVGFSLIATVVRFLSLAVQERSSDVPVVLTDRYRIPSRFDRAHLDSIVKEGGSVNEQLKPISGFRPEQYNLWHFLGFTLDPDLKDKDLIFFTIATIPEKIPTMVDELGDLDPRLCELMKNPPKSRLEHSGILMGPDRLKKIRKQVGDVFTATSISHRDGTGARKPIEMQFEIVGELPANTRWSQGAFMDYAMVDAILHQKQSDLDGKIMLGWLKFDDQDSAAKSSAVIERNIADIKSEIASSAVSRFMEPYKDLLNGVKYLLVPAILVVMMIVIANSISITVRERTSEMAVLKVLGFRPGQILTLILGEGLLLGLVGGLLGAAITYVTVNFLFGGIRIPIQFFSIFFVPAHVFWWGPLLGLCTSFVGSVIPAWTARGIKVSEVFAKVA